MRERFFNGRREMIHRDKIILIPLGIIAFLALFSFIVMQLWNHLLPDIFHLPLITFWQAMGILVLSKILFGFSKPGGGRFGGGGRGPWMRRGIEEKLKHMTPEQKARFKTQMKERMCGPRGKSWEDFFEEEDGNTETTAPGA